MTRATGVIRTIVKLRQEAVTAVTVETVVGTNSAPQKYSGKPSPEGGRENCVATKRGQPAFLAAALLNPVCGSPRLGGLLTKRNSLVLGKRDHLQLGIVKLRLPMLDALTASGVRAPGQHMFGHEV